MNKIGVSFTANELLERNYRNENIFIEISDFCMPDKVDKGESLLGKICPQYEISCIQGPVRDWKTEAMDNDFKQLTMNKAKKLIDLAHKYKIGKILFFSTYDRLVKLESYDSMWVENNVLFWQEVAEYAEKRNVVCLYCNVWDCKPELMKEVFDRVNSENFKFGFDIGHAYYSCDFELEQWVDVLEDYINYVCVHDNNGDMDAHLLIGQGKINLKKIMKYISEKKRDLMYCLQLFDNTGFEDSLSIMSTCVNAN